MTQAPGFSFYERFCAAAKAGEEMHNQRGSIGLAVLWMTSLALFLGGSLLGGEDFEELEV